MFKKLIFLIKYLEIYARVLLMYLLKNALVTLLLKDIVLIQLYKEININAFGKEFDMFIEVDYQSKLNGFSR